MEFFIDTGEIDEIKEAATWGFVDGVTTNPSLVAKSGKAQDQLIREIVEIIDGPISAEVNSLDYDGMLKEIDALKGIHENVVIKLPLTIDGLKACKWCTENAIKTNVTLCFSANQALLAAKNGATYISPFVGRVDDIGQDGMQIIEEIRTIYDNFGFTTKILSASIRHADHVKQSALLGADVATVPFKVLKQLVHHPLTDNGLAQFVKDFENSKK